MSAKVIFCGRVGGGHTRIEARAVAQDNALPWLRPKGNLQDGKDDLVARPIPVPLPVCGTVSFFHSP